MPAGRGTPATVEVRIKNFAFAPAMVTVPVGTTVVWRNTEGFHTVLSADFLLQSEPLDVGGTYSYTFTKPGTYPYECGIHPEMVAVIQVVP
jgi:plastocyanin